MKKIDCLRIIFDLDEYILFKDFLNLFFFQFNVFNKHNL